MSVVVFSYVCRAVVSLVLSLEWDFRRILKWKAGFSLSFPPVSAAAAAALIHNKLYIIGRTNVEQKKKKSRSFHTWATQFGLKSLFSFLIRNKNSWTLNNFLMYLIQETDHIFLVDKFQVPCSCTSISNQAYKALAGCSGCWLCTAAVAECCKCKCHFLLLLPKNSFFWSVTLIEFRAFYSTRRGECPTIIIFAASIEH